MTGRTRRFQWKEIDGKRVKVEICPPMHAWAKDPKKLAERASREKRRAFWENRRREWLSSLPSRKK